MKILITGSTGMVGRNIIENPNLSSCNILAPSSNQLDLTDWSSLKKYIQQNNPEIIIHCAGLVGGIQANIENPVNFLKKNTLMGINIISAAKEANIPNLINLASSCMYPRFAQNPLKESSLLSGELEPTNEGYALSKLISTRLCEYVCRERPDLNYKTIIPCNLYGRFDHFDPSRSHLIPAIIRKLDDAINNNDSSVEIWGDGLARREFMYASDLSDFIFKIIPILPTLPSNVNVGFGKDYSIKEYYETAAKIIGYKGKFIFNKSKPVGMKQKLVDISIQNTLKWKASTSLEVGIKKTYEFYKGA